MKKDKTKLLIIQPHSDDALFSCSHFLFNPEKYEVEVLTVENNPKRIAEDKKLYEFLGIPNHFLQTDFDDQSYYGYFKENKEVTVDAACAFLKKFFGSETLTDIEYKLESFLEKFFKTHKDYKIVAPWGVGHPFHIFIRDILEKNISYMMYYRDFPHSYKKRSKSQVENQLTTYKLIESAPVEEFHDVKWELAKKFYKTQSGLLFFESGYINKKLPEEVYVKIEQEMPFEL